MLNWKEQFVAKKTALINRNGEYESPKLLHLDPDWSYIDFLNAASNRLDLAHSAKRVFNANGVEIDDCMMIEEDDRLFLSQGEAYLNPRINTGKRNEVNSSNSTISHKNTRDKSSDKSRFAITTVGPYNVGEILGRGGFGEVREGTNQVTGEKVALKFIKKSEIQSMGAVEKAAVEIKCQSILRHQNIIKLEMNLETNKYIVLAFELMRGGDLAKFLSEKGPNSTLSEDSARHAFQQILAGVSYAHNNNIIHRDLKLENILLVERSLDKLKIADFGLSEFYRPGGMLSSTSGTLSYQAPEVVSGISHAGPPLDVWAMGVILFSILCGRLPFEGSRTIMSKRPMEAIIKEKIIKCQYTLTDTLSNDAKVIQITDLVKRMLCLDPSKRASIPDILSHRWMRAESYIRRVSIVQPAPTASHSEESNFVTAQLMPLPIHSFESCLNELSVPVSCSTDGYTSYRSPDSRVHNPPDDLSPSLHLRVDVDVGTATKSAYPYDGTLSNSSYDTQSDSGSTWNCRSFSIDNATDASGSIRMRSSRGVLPYDHQLGASTITLSAMETFSLSCLSTPMATPGATPRTGSGADHRIGPQFTYQDGVLCESVSIESTPSDKMRREAVRDYSVGESPVQGSRGSKEGLYSPLGSYDLNSGRRFSDLSLSHTHSSHITESGLDGMVKSVPLFQLVPLRRKNKDGLISMSPGSVHSRTLESDSEDTVMSTSPMRPLRDNTKSPIAPEGKRTDPKSLGSGSGGRGRKDTLNTRPRSMQAVLLTGVSGKFRPNSILSIEEQPSQFPCCDSDSAMDSEDKQEEEVKDGVCTSEPPIMPAACVGHLSKEREREREQPSINRALYASSASDMDLGPGLDAGLGLGLEHSVSASSDALSLKIVATASTSSLSTIGSAAILGKCSTDIEKLGIGMSVGMDIGGGGVAGGGAGGCSVKGEGIGEEDGAVPLPHRDTQYPP